MENQPTIAVGDTLYYVTATRAGSNISYQTVSSTEFKPFAGEKLLSHAFLMDSFRKIMGRTLTVIDASVSEPKQNKAMKDLVRNIFSDEMEFASSMAFDQEKLNEAALAAKEHSEELPEPITIDEALGVD